MFLTSTCPHCKTRIPFDIKGAYLHKTLIQNMNCIIYFNIFSKCRECKLPTIFSIYRNITNATIHENIAERWLDKDDIAKETTKWTVYINQEEDSNLLDKFQIEKIIRQPVNITYQCPEHVPKEIKEKFNEAAQCQANDCIVASSLMLRLCLETVIKDLLKTNNEQKQRVSLSDGIKKLSDKNLME